MAVLLGACAVGPDYVRPPAPAVRGYTATPIPRSVPAATGVQQRIEQSNRLAADWWRLLGSPAIDAMVVDALVCNPGIEGARAALRRSEDLLRAGYGVFFPQLDGAVAASRQRYSPARVGSPLPPTTFNLFTVSGSVGYTLDLWGGQRRNVESLQGQVAAERYALIGAELVLSANVVNAAIAEAGYRAQIEATAAILALEEDQTKVAAAQAKAGTVPYANVVSLESQVALTRATIPPLRQKVTQAQHLLAVLTARPPGEWTPPSIELAALTLPAQVPLSLPAEVVRQRPDILVAEAQLASSTAQIGVATAALLPNVTLTANLGANNGALANLLGTGSVFWGVAAGLTQPIFHGGALYYQRRAAIDARDQALAVYKQTVLTAFQQVADSLDSLGNDAEALRAQTEAQGAAESALHLVQTSYGAGLGTYLQLLTADAQVLVSRVGVIQAETQRLQDTVALFVALGGGWWNASGNAIPQ